MKTQESPDIPHYSLSVYAEHALITGFIRPTILKDLFLICKKEGFTWLVEDPDGLGIKVVRKNYESKKNKKD